MPNPIAPHVGMIVVYHPGDVLDEAKPSGWPAVVTHVHDENTVNLNVFQDGEAPTIADAWPTSVPYFEPEMTGPRWESAGLL